MRYNYCYNLCGHIVFNQRDITYCTIGNNTKNGQIPYFMQNYNGEPLDLEQIAQTFETIREKCKQGIYPEICEGCQFFVEDDWDKIYPVGTRELQYLQFSSWIRCNSDCIFCDNHVLPNAEKKTDLYDALPVLKSFIDANLITKNTEIDFAGGEPTLYYRLSEMLDLLLCTGVKKISIHTNAINYNKVIEKGIKQGIISICVSVDAGTKKIHKKVKQVDSYDKVWKNIKKYSKAKNPIFKNYVSLKYIIIPDVNDNFDEIDMFVEKAIKAGVSHIILNADSNIYKKEVSPETLDRIIGMTGFFVSKCHEKNIKMELQFNIRAAYIMRNKTIPQNTVQIIR